MMNNEPILQMQAIELTAKEIPEAAEMTAMAMCTNPLHVAIFNGTNAVALQKQTKLFEFALKLAVGKNYIVKQDDQIIGMMGYIPGTHCQLTPLQIMKAKPAMCVALGTSLLSVLRWRRNWAKHDCSVPHLHFGPLAVHPQFQGKGIGTLLLRQFCSYADSTLQDAYLETDKEENVRLYEKFDFKITGIDQNLGVTNWFMFRKARVH